MAAKMTAEVYRVTEPASDRLVRNLFFWRDIPLEDLGGIREEKTVMIIRYGAIGDMIMVSSLLTSLKEDGYRVCVNTEGRGMEILKHDPSIDEFIVQEQGQIDPTLLKEWTEFLGQMFERVIDLSRSVEHHSLAVGYQKMKVKGVDTFLAPSPQFELSHEEREELYGEKNYLEETHKIAGVPFVPRPRFYPTLPERRTARVAIDKFKKKNGLRTIVVWALTGSTAHKMYPYMDDAIKLVFAKGKDIGIMFVGAEWDRILGDPWKYEPRISNVAGRMTVRETLTLALLADIVVGPETGVMNAASHEPNKKILFLSHSNHTNLSRDWVNTVALHTKKAECYPCHQLHLRVAECPADEITMMPVCTDLDPIKVANEILKPAQAYPDKLDDTELLRTA